jgi:hypothetical protein
MKKWDEELNKNAVLTPETTTGYLVPGSWNAVDSPGLKT